MTKLLLTAVLAGLQLTAIGRAQDAVPGEIMNRTVAIRMVKPDGSSEQGTAFVINHKNKLYEVTARHVMEGVAEQNPTNVQIRQGGNWKTLPVKRVLYPSSADVDIAILEVTILPSESYSIGLAGENDKSSTVWGQPIWFLGYPFIEGLGTKFRGNENTAMPFVKKGVLSAMDASNPDAIILYIDGLNNAGFSGGPILYYDFTLHQYLILGVVRGYRNENAEADVKGKRIQTNVLLNSGILIGYSNNHIIDAIEKASSAK